MQGALNMEEGARAWNAGAPEAGKAQDPPENILGRKVMTNLDGIFKSRDITLPTKVHLVKAMVFSGHVWM